MPKKPERPRHKDKHRGKPKHRQGKQHDSSPNLPDICVLTVVGVSNDGELIAQPLKWNPRHKPPHIVVTESGRNRAATIGDKILSRLRRIKPHLYHALVIRVLPAEEAKQIVGVFIKTADGGIIEPVSRKNKESYIVATADTNGAEHGELVSGITIPAMPSMSMTYAKINERLGRMDSPRAASLIAASMYNLPSIFPKEAVEESELAELPTLSDGREDLREFPLVTIDGEDAKDFDDAVYAKPEKDGFHLLIAIADVAHYVKEDSALDRTAFERGNSVYFPDRVIPMLPERLSNGLCSLNPNEDRYCLAVHIWIDAQGNMKRYKFVRGLMKSRYRFTYNELQAVHDTGSEHPLRTTIIEPLFEAYKALATERDKRGALALSLPEYKIIFDAAGNVENIAPRVQLESHRLIESFMIAANVAAADFLLKNKAPGIYRVHEHPAEERLDELRNFLKLAGYSLQNGAISATHLNRVLKASANDPGAFMIHTAVLRSQMQAYYSHECLGHFGLALQKYCHFTSPIRRYSDLIVHRSLINVISGEKKKHTAHDLPTIALHISETERKAMQAERDASDRYKVSFMSKHIGNTFSGTIVSLNEYGLFVSLADCGVTGFVPVRNLQGDFFTYDKQHARFKGQRTKMFFTIGQPIIIRVQEANATTGSLIFMPEPGGEPDRRPADPPRRHKHRQEKRRDNKHRRRR
ncbi:MAG: ribonuclease R [Alphaproteobacteria bacterium]